MKYSIAYILLLTALHMSCTFVYGQTPPTYTGPIAKPTDGYGQDGVYAQVREMEITVTILTGDMTPN